MFVFVLLAALLAGSQNHSTSKAHPLPLLALDGGDYVYPRLSPDGTRLLVARAYKKPSGADTTDVFVIDVASAVAREIVSRAQAEENEVYETFVVNIEWLDNRRATISLSDGDVGRTELMVDVVSGGVLHKTSERDGDELVPTEFRDVAASADLYKRDFSRDELERSLAASAIRLTSGRVIVQRSARAGALQPVFLIDPKLHRIERIGMVTPEEDLSSAKVTPEGLVLLFTGDKGGQVAIYRSGHFETLGRLSAQMKDDCPRLQIGGGRHLVFTRPCVTSEPASGRVWELNGGSLVERSIDPHLDDLSLSADGSLIAITSWQHDHRVVRVFKTVSVLGPAG